MKTPAKLIVASLALAAGAALAQGYGRGFGPGMGPGMGYWNLSAEQRDRVAAVREEHRGKHWATMDALRTEQWKLRDLHAAKADAATIAEQQKKVDALREQMFQQRAAMHREMDAALER